MGASRRYPNVPKFFCSPKPILRSRVERSVDGLEWVREKGPERGGMSGRASERGRKGGCKALVPGMLAIESQFASASDSVFGSQAGTPRSQNTTNGLFSAVSTVPGSWLR